MMPDMRMMHGPILAVALIAVTGAVAEDPPRSFDAADVHLSPSTSGWSVSAMREPVLYARAGQIRGDRYEVHAVTLIDLIASAYAIDPAKLIGGPEWIDTARFDLIAKVPAGTTAGAIPGMMQTLLAERFHLRVHPGNGLFSELVLRAGPTPHLKASTGGPDSGCKSAPASPDISITCHNVTMAQLTQTLPQLAGDYFQGNPLVDQTRLSGVFDFSLRWTPHRKVTASGAGGTSLPSAVETQLGLNLAWRDVSEPALLIDRADPVPTPNAPSIAQLLPPVQLAFEVAVIKPAAPDSTARGFHSEPGGRLNIQGQTLKELIEWAWNIMGFDVLNNEELLVGAPKLIESIRYDVAARTPANAPTDWDALRLMLRALVVERFGLTTHDEMRTVSVEVLVAAKPRLQRAAPRSRSGCRNVPTSPQPGMLSAPIFSVRCTNTTMPQLAQKLQPLGARAIPLPVMDETGLAGAFDFTLSWSPPWLMDSSNAEPDGSLSFVEALDKQLGLKLRPAKRSMPVLVVDRVNPAPTPN